VHVLGIKTPENKTETQHWEWYSWEGATGKGFNTLKV